MENPELFAGDRAKFIQDHGIKDLRFHKGSIIGKMGFTHNNKIGQQFEFVNFGKTMKSAKDQLGY
jgi:hypothetical protein